MTKSQEMSLAVFRHSVEVWCDDMDVEIKEWTVSDDYKHVMVVAETGSVGDEGTLAQVWCRDRALIFIGPRGGMWCYVHGKRCRVKYPYFLSAALAYKEDIGRMMKRKEERA